MINTLQLEAIAEFGEEMPSRAEEWRGKRHGGSHYGESYGPNVNQIVNCNWWDIVDLLEWYEKVKAAGKELPQITKLHKGKYPIWAFKKWRHK